MAYGGGAGIVGSPLSSSVNPASMFGGPNRNRGSIGPTNPTNPTALFGNPSTFTSAANTQAGEIGRASCRERV